MCGMRRKWPNAFINYQFICLSVVILYLKRIAIYISTFFLLLCALHFVGAKLIINKLIFLRMNFNILLNELHR